MLIQKSENVFGPNVSSKVSKAVAVPRGVTVGRINLELVCLARVLHLRRERLARRQVVIVLGLEEENRRLRMANGAGHARLQFWRLRPAFSATIRNGAFMNRADFLRSAHRGSASDKPNYAVSFRVARSMVN